MWLETLPMSATTAIVAAASVAIVFVVSRVLMTRWRWLFAFLVPFSVAYCLYWTPVWSGADSLEYSAWAGIFIGVWGMAGAVSCSILVAVLRSHRNKRA
jgi:hypothetical protein